MRLVLMQCEPRPTLRIPWEAVLRATGGQVLSPKSEQEAYALVSGGLVVGDQMVFQGGCF